MANLHLFPIYLFINFFSPLLGIMWPLEGIPLVLRCIGYLLPFTLPSRTFLSLMFHELSFTDATIYLGFMIVLGWIVIELAICIWLSWPKAEEKKK